MTARRPTDRTASLATAHAAEAPDGASGLRLATPADYDLFARFFADLGTEDPVPSPDDWAAGMASRTDFLERDGRSVGYALIEALADTGYVRHVVVEPSARRGGVGTALMRAIAARLRGAGCTRWCLNVKPENRAALALYARIGMHVAYDSVSLRFRWACAARLDAATRTVEAAPVLPADDATVEAAFALPAGQLAGFRALPGQVLVALHERGGPGGVAGFARFVPAFPGAFPFRVASPDLASALLTALRPHARPEHDDLQLTAEDDPALAAALVRAGGDVRMRLHHLRGALDGV